MSVLKLRTLTKKSKLGFGKYSEHTIDELIKRMRPYLVWVYYNASNITFTEDILKNDLGIFEDKLIDKPGKKPELYTITSAVPTRTLKAYKIKSHNKKEMRTTMRNHQKRRENIWFNKAANAWKNQGH